MLDGKSSGTLLVSYRSARCGDNQVMVTKMPEDFWHLRISFLHQGETVFPTLKITEVQAKNLWAALKATAEDLKWSDEIGK